MPADDADLDERRIFQRDAVGDGMHGVCRRGRNGRMTDVADRDAVARLDARSVGASGEHDAGGRVSGQKRIRRSRVRELEVERALGSRADHARRDLDGDLVPTGGRHLDRQQLGDAGRGEDDGFRRAEASPSGHRLHASSKPPPRLALGVPGHLVGVAETREQVRRESVQDVLQRRRGVTHGEELSLVLRSSHRPTELSTARCQE